MLTTDLIYKVPSVQPKSKSSSNGGITVQCRSIESAASAVNREARTARFSVLDDSWILRFDWDTWEMYDLQFEISDKAINRTRIDAKTALFTDEHRDDRRIGKITDCSIKDGKVYFEVKIGNSEWGTRYMQECADGVEPGKSIEVFIEELEEVEPAIYEGEGWDRRLVQRAKKKATRYQFSGVSTVSTPAVGTVGFSADEMAGLMQLSTVRLQFQQQFSTLQSQLEKLMSQTQSQTHPTTNQTQEPIAPAPAPAPTTENLSADQTSTPSSGNEDVMALRSQLEALQAELAQQAADRRREGIQNFLAQNSGRITPAMREFKAHNFDIAAFMQSLNAEQLNYFQAWTKQCLHQVTPATAVIPPGEFRSTVQSSPLTPQQLATEAKEYAKANSCDYGKAIDAVMAKHGVVNR